MDQSLEEWRPVVGYERLYEVSSLGRVRGLSRKVPHSAVTAITIKRKLLRLHLGSHGYLQFSPWKKGVQQTLLVHQEVLKAFVGEAMGLECRHLDGNRVNNMLSNLDYGTKSQNANDKRRHGTMVQGEKQRHAKLTEDAVRHIRNSPGVTGRALAKMHGVHATTVSKIRLGYTWTHLDA